MDEPEVTVGDVTISKNLQCPLTEEEALKMSRYLSKRIQDKGKSEDDKSEAVAAFNAKLKSIDAEINEMSRKINQGYEYRDVDCFWTYFCTLGYKVLARKDTGEEVIREPIESHERQQQLFKPDPKPDSKKGMNDRQAPPPSIVSAPAPVDPSLCDGSDCRAFHFHLSTENGKPYATCSNYSDTGDVINRTEEGKWLRVKACVEDNSPNVVDLEGEGKETVDESLFDHLCRSCVVSGSVKAHSFIEDSTGPCEKCGTENVDMFRVPKPTEGPVDPEPVPVSDDPPLLPSRCLRQVQPGRNDRWRKRRSFLHVDRTQHHLPRR